MSINSAFSIEHLLSAGAQWQYNTAIVSRQGSLTCQHGFVITHIVHDERGFIILYKWGFYSSQDDPVWRGELYYFRRLLKMEKWPAFVHKILHRATRVTNGACSRNKSSQRCFYTCVHFRIIPRKNSQMEHIADENVLLFFPCNCLPSTAIFSCAIRIVLGISTSVDKAFRKWNRYVWL